MAVREILKVLAKQNSARTGLTILVRLVSFSSVSRFVSVTTALSIPIAQGLSGIWLAHV